MCPRYILRILLLDILIEYRAIVAAITFTREMESMSRILRESTHETLKRLPEIWRCTTSRVRCECLIRVTVGAACPEVLSIVGASCVWQGDNYITWKLSANFATLKDRRTHVFGSTYPFTGILYEKPTCAISAPFHPNSRSRDLPASADRYISYC